MAQKKYVGAHSHTINFIAFFIINGHLKQKVRPSQGATEGQLREFETTRLLEIWISKRQRTLLTRHKSSQLPLTLPGS